MTREDKTKMSAMLYRKLTKKNLLSLYFCFFFKYVTLPSSFHSSTPHMVHCQVVQAGWVPHHKACSGLDESLNYLMATVGAFRRCHLPSKRETGWLTGWYTCGTVMNHSHWGKCCKIKSLVFSNALHAHKCQSLNTTDHIHSCSFTLK